MVMWCDICGAKLENGETLSECPECLCPFENVDKNSPRKEFKSPIPDGNLVKAISTDENFMKAMTELYENDPIEYKLKMSQFKANLKQQERSKPKEEDNRPKCPNCHSTNIQKISGTKRWFSTGLFGLASSDIGKSMVCKQCGYKW
ncbi:MAG: hypothetical protein ACLSG9_01875 [Eubacterium sp.]